MKKKIIFSAGGTGGHIFPAINLMKYYKEMDYEVILVTDIRGNNFVKKNLNFKTYILNTDTPTNKNLLKKILSFLSILNSIIKSIIILKKERPNLIFGLGGYVSFPISFSSRFFNLPLVIYENNSILGRANRYLLRFSRKIFLARSIIKNFPEKYADIMYETGPVLKKELTEYQDLKNKNNNKTFSILVVGGSQGAEIFGQVIPQAIKMIAEKGFSIEINQQCISKQKKSITDYYSKNNIKNYIFEFEENILRLISSSDLAITRCGASATAELMYTFTPFIAVPLPNSIDNHQYLNAKYYENKGCCWLLEQNNFTSEKLSNLIIEIIKNKNKLESIRENMKKNYKKNVYKDIENQVKEIINI